MTYKASILKTGNHLIREATSNGGHRYEISQGQFQCTDSELPGQMEMLQCGTMWIWDDVRPRAMKAWSFVSAFKKW